MEGSPFDIIIFAPLAPFIGIVIIWLLQLILIDSEKYLLTKIRQKHEALCKLTNFLGILFQNFCHILGYTITNRGVSEFSISITHEHVKPLKDKKGLFEWISNAFLNIGPFFLPSIILFICLLFLLNNGFNISVPEHILNSKYTFVGQINIFIVNLYNFTKNFFSFILNIDLLHPGHFGFFILMVFLGMGIRPSYINESKQKKITMLSDLKKIWEFITYKPIYLIYFILLFYIIYYILLFLNLNYYVSLFIFLGWLSVISIISIIIADMIILLIKTSDNFVGRIRYLPFIVLISSYLFMRIFFFFIPNNYSNILSIFVMVISTIIILLYLYRNKTNKFKTNISIKSSKKKKIMRKGNTNEE